MGTPGRPQRSPRTAPGVTIGAAAARDREQSRASNGRFGVQGHTEQDGDLRVDVPREEGCPTPEVVIQFAAYRHGFDEPMTSDLFARAFRQAAAGPLTAKNRTAWSDFCIWRSQRCLPPLSDRYFQARCAPPDDPKMVRAILAMNRREDDASKALAAHVTSIAATRGVHQSQVKSFVRASRIQYLSDPDGHPSPPSDWVTGFTTRAYDGRCAPHDPATLHALYRA